MNFKILNYEILSLKLRFEECSRMPGPECQATGGLAWFHPPHLPVRRVQVSGRGAGREEEWVAAA